jgi:hypothetical protein
MRMPKKPVITTLWLFPGLRLSQWPIILFLLITSVCTAAAGQPSPDPSLPRLETNESYIRSLRATGLDIKNPRAVFQFVLDSLPPQVTVYPTENYYYFRFNLDGVGYSGNIRLDPTGRARAEVNFGYYKDTNEWLETEDEGEFAIFGAADGIIVKPVSTLSYEISSNGTSVLFQLNDLSDVRPPAAALAEGDRFLGPVFDESGIRFFLLFNDRYNRFAFVLDETQGRSEELIPLTPSARVLLGRRTGFAFYAETPHRLILMAVYAPNVQVNNYYDGPFDQLPDNFIEGDALRDAILKVDPGYEGKIDRFGNLAGRPERYLVSPYRSYLFIEELVEMGACADAAEGLDARLACFDDPELADTQAEGEPQPGATRHPRP